LAQRADAVVAITDSVRRFAIDKLGLPAAKVETIHYGLDEPPPPWNGDVVDAPSGRMLLGVGRLVEQKGYDTLVRALPAIRAAHPDAVLVIVGEGPLRRPLMRLAADLGVADALHLPGRSGDVAAWMRRAEVFVHPCRWEGFGLVVLEAMLLGLPIVATRVSALPELIEHPVSGILVEPDNDATLAAAAIELLGEASRRTALGAAAQQRARTAFSVARMTDATVALYRRVAAARSPAAQESDV
jgi:glycosyltransferase involved in cell wall biosynthesis